MKTLNTGPTAFGSTPLSVTSKRNESLLLVAHATANTDLAPLTPLAFNENTAKYQVYDTAETTYGGNRIACFVWPDTHVQTVTTDSSVVAMVEGEIHDYDELKAVIVAMGIDPDDFLADLKRSNLREKNIYIKNLPAGAGFFRRTVSGG